MLGDPIDFMHKGANIFEENSYLKSKIFKLIKSVPIFPIKSKYPLIIDSIFTSMLVLFTTVIWLNVFFLFDLH
jgi:hypothetical protein